MANLQSSGAISLANIKGLFGGPASPSLANYYRGGSYIPSSKTVGGTAREPASGENYVQDSYVWYWFQTSSKFVAWAGTQVATGVGDGGSVTVGAYTYYSGTLRYSANGSYGTANKKYGVYRTYSTSSTVSINTGVPSSGAISMNQFYGAEKP